MLNAPIDARRPMPAFVLLALGALFLAGAHAGTDERAQMVHDLYEEFTSHGIYCEEDKMSKFFSADIVKEIMKACKADEYPPYTIIPGNDYDDAEVMRTLKVVPGSGSAYKASFTNFSEPHTITYTFEKQRGQWRITGVE